MPRSALFSQLRVPHSVPKTLARFPRRLQDARFVAGCTNGLGPLVKRVNAQKVDPVSLNCEDGMAISFQPPILWGINASRTLQNIVRTRRGFKVDDLYARGKDAPVAQTE